ncbi:hypothetical protein FHP25_22050 [Vineibacter terrae]|uniref:Alkaline phosphatase family protein n=1 Tax=Vineibacter terrae TaxID=2586908 RepID=A0A5C8PIR3_9HYPH|nr:alkaline phosphatase family protein [Vineibacter terrae]TXL73120.1 hypothetical protein FHP25_22050 [Vineibacter terrae]
MSTRSLIVVFDGLRPDMVTPALMPNLHAFQLAHCRFPRSRCVFPSETRVNAASLVTGCHAGRHGVVGNQFHAAAVFADRWIRTSERADLQAADAVFAGGLISVPSLGERLSAAGRTLAVVSTGSTGSGWLLHHRAEALRQLRWSAHGPAHSTPVDAWTEIAQRFGLPPAAGTPQTARIDHATTVLLEHVLPVVDPDVAIIWFTDPDYTYHYRGIGSVEAMAALQGVDAAFGRVVDAWRRAPNHDRRAIFVVSDHGHITNRERIDLLGAMTAGGFSVDKRASGDADLGLVPGSASAVLLRRRDDGLGRAVVDWLAGQPWCGALFSNGPDETAGAIPGTFNRTLLGLDSARAADLLFTLAHDDAPGNGGWPGGGLHDSDLPPAGGNHGGLHPREMSNMLVAGGAGLRTQFVSPGPAGIIDVMPTVLHLLGLPAAGCDGRVLGEALVDGAMAPHDTRRLAMTAGRHAHHIVVSHAGATRYVDGGGRG